MCGIVGFATAEKLIHFTDRRDFWVQGMIAGVPRGLDSTGMYAVEHNNNAVHMQKNLCWGPDFIQLREVRRMMDHVERLKVVVGHHRAKTTGQITRQDAHPHQVDHITLVHNGGISNEWQLPGWQHHEDHPNVDTYKLTYAIAHAGYKRVLENARGAWALVWWDAKESTLNITRNKDRPLALCWGEDRKSLYFASEWAMLGWLMHRNKLKQDKPIFTIKENILYKFHVEDDITLETEKYEESISTVHVNRPSPFLDRPVQERQHHYHRTDKEEKSSGNPPMSHLPAVQRAIAEAREAEKSEGSPARTREPVGLTKAKIVHMNKKLERLSKKLYHNALIWAMPITWKSFRKSTTDNRGFATLNWPQIDIPVQVHDITASAWKELLKKEGILMPIRVVSMGQVQGEPILYGKIDVANFGKSHEVINAIPDDDEYLSIFPGLNGMYFSKKEFLEITKQGCYSCKQPIPLIEADIMDWLDEMPICSRCAPQIQSGALCNG